MSKIGLFGGSFNPIHKGHVNLALSIRESLKLDRVIFIPSGKAPHKSSSEYAKAGDRLEMCKLAISEYPFFEVSDFEINRDGKSYSIYTINHFKKLYPDDELFLMVGSDMLIYFDKWYKYQEILKNVTLTAVSREGTDFEWLEHTAKKLRGYGEIIIVNNQPFPISSTILRKMLKNNEDTSCYLDKKVVKYIMMNKIYFD